jgi:hypothetical protein
MPGGTESDTTKKQSDSLLLRTQHAEGKHLDPNAVWCLHLGHDHAPIISHAAVTILSICASEAAVEKKFSAQGLVHSELRNRLGDDAVEALRRRRFSNSIKQR